MIEMAKKRHHTHHYSHERDLKRICVTLDSALREALNLPSDIRLKNPFPVSLERATEYLQRLLSTLDRWTLDDQTEPQSTGQEP